MLCFVLINSSFVCLLLFCSGGGGGGVTFYVTGSCLWPLSVILVSDFPPRYPGYTEILGGGRTAPRACAEWCSPLNIVSVQKVHRYLGGADISGVQRSRV